MIRAHHGVPASIAVALYLSTTAFACDDDSAASPAPSPDGGDSDGTSDGGSGGDARSSDGGGKPATRWSVTVELASSFAVADAVYVAGANSQATNVKWRIEKRSLVDGALVPDFGNGGTVESPLAPSDAMSGGLRLSADGDSVYVTGHFGGSTRRLERRRASDGSLVWAKTLGLCDDEQQLVAVDDASVYAGCFGVLEKRAKASGELEPSFADGGIAISPRPDNGGLSVSHLVGLFSQTGAIIGYGQRAVVGPSDFERFQNALSASTGAVNWEKVASPAITAAGGAGNATSAFFSTTSNGTWLIERRSISTGDLEAGFGNGGRVTGAADEDGLRPLVAAHGNRVFVATVRTDPTNFARSTAVRAFDAANGTPIAGFGEGGRTLSPQGSKDGFSNVVGGVVADEVSVYTASSDYREGEQRIRIEKRDRETGAL